MDCPNIIKYRLEAQAEDSSITKLSFNYRGDKPLKKMLSVIGSIYSLNAKSACGYCCTRSSKTDRDSFWGSFMFTSEFLTLSQYDWYYDYETKSLWHIIYPRHKEH